MSGTVELAALLATMRPELSLVVAAQAGIHAEVAGCVGGGWIPA